MKEEIIKEFVEKITDYGYNNEYGYYNEWADGVRPIVEKYIDKIIDDILEKLPEINERTKRTEQSLTPDQIAYESGYSFCRTKIKDYKNI